MKSLLSKWLPLAIFVLLLCGFGYLAAVDVPVARSTVEKSIPNDRFFN